MHAERNRERCSQIADGATAEYLKRLYSEYTPRQMRVEYHARGIEQVYWSHAVA